MPISAVATASARWSRCSRSAAARSGARAPACRRASRRASARRAARRQPRAANGCAPESAWPPAIPSAAASAKHVKWSGTNWPRQRRASHCRTVSGRASRNVFSLGAITVSCRPSSTDYAAAALGTFHVMSMLTAPSPERRTATPARRRVYPRSARPWHPPAPHPPGRGGARRRVRRARRARRRPGPRRLVPGPAAIATGWPRAGSRCSGLGSFPDSIRQQRGWGRYGEAGLGYGLMLSGLGRAGPTGSRPAPAPSASPSPRPRPRLGLREHADRVGVHPAPPAGAGDPAVRHRPPGVGGLPPRHPAALRREHQAAA